MASDDTKDYILEFKIKNLNMQREALKQSQENLDKLLKKQFKALKRTGFILTIYTVLVVYQVGVNIGWWSL